MANFACLTTPRADVTACPCKQGNTLDEKVRHLMNCRSFLWDVLTDGEWTGCAAPILAELRAEYGDEETRRAIDAHDNY